LNFHPDFLCGTTAKTRRYGTGTYYPTLLKRFEENLCASQNLITIGFSFCDQRIEQYIKEAFLIEQNRQMFIVDVREPKTELLSRENVYYVKGGVVDMDIGFILDQVK
jgi:homospermidine synthase